MVEALVILGILGIMYLVWDHLAHQRCEKDGTILVEGTFNHLICPKCGYVRHLD